MEKTGQRRSETERAATGGHLNQGKQEQSIHLLGTITVLLKTIGWAVEAIIKVIGGSRPSIVGRELMSSFGLQLIQKTPPGRT